VSDEVPVHRRTVTVTSRECAEGEIEVEAELTDERPWARSEAGGDGRAPVIHRMALVVRVRVADRTILDARADMRVFPHAECPAITPAFEGLVGLRIAAGFNRAVQDRFRGVLGCSHLYELARTLGPAVVQAGISAAARRRPAGVPTHDPRATPGVLGSCHVWASGGPGLLKLEAGWQPGLGAFPVPPVEHFTAPPEE
jgi:Protein of unknown function (DUF2889)